MGTRATGILINDKRALVTTEFNGDMYPSGYGELMYAAIQQSENELAFKEAMERLNEIHKQYNDGIVYNEPLKKYMKVVDGEQVLSLSSRNYFEKYGSDWLYIKNLSSKAITIKTMDRKTILLETGKTMGIRFGKHESHFLDIETARTKEDYKGTFVDEADNKFVLTGERQNENA